MSNTTMPNDPFQGIQVDSEEIDGQIWFNIIDVCGAFGIGSSQASRYTRSLPKECLRLTQTLRSNGRPYSIWYVNKRGIGLILQRSNKPIPKATIEWLSTDVLFDIVEDGGYVALWSTSAQRARMQEKLDYREVLEIIANASDYDKHKHGGGIVFPIVQNMFHMELVGMNARQILASGRPVITKTGKTGATKADMKVAKNYLTQDELELYGINLTYVITKFKKRYHKRTYTVQDVMEVIYEGLHDK